MNRRNFLYQLPAAAVLPFVPTYPERKAVAGLPDLPVSKFGAANGASIQAALNAAKGTGKRVVLDSPFYTIDQPIVMAGHVATHVIGFGASPAEGGTQLQWNGAASGNVWEINDCRNCHFSDFSVTVAGGLPASSAFVLSNTNGNEVVPTSNSFDRVVVQGVNGAIGYGWRFTGDHYAGLDANNDFHRFVECEVSNYNAAAWSLEHSQCKALSFVDCRAYGQFGEVGVATNQGDSGHGGSFHWYGGFMHANSVADFALGTPNDAILIQGLNSEHSARFILTNGPTGAAWPVRAVGVRWESGALAADGRIVDVKTPGPFSLDSCQFRTSTPGIVYAQTWAAYGAYSVRNCQFDTRVEMPVDFATAAAQWEVVNSVNV